MATLSRSETRRLYSWWWDSHNSPKNSKWLQDNLTDMDAKVKSMIKLIEEDADSFARRAEMYYKKRPELLKLVEEFYRAYRALAERYNYATGELRHAHRTIAKAFPDQVPLELIEESPSKPQERDPHTQETKFPIRRALFDTFDLLDGEKNGLRDEREKEETFCDEVLELSNENQHLMEKVVEERERAGKAESEVEGLKKALSDLQVEKESVLLKYQQCLEKLSDMEGELNSAQKASMKFNEKASRAEIEVQTLKEALYQLETEKNAGSLKHNEYLEKISKLEAMISRIQEDNKGHETRAIEAESDSKALKDEVSRLEVEKGAVLQQYKQCFERISALESLISVNENEASLLKKEAERAENEVSELRKSLLDLKREKEASASQYKCCLETISKLERDIAGAKEEVKRLNNDVLMGNLKLKTAEDKCTVLEMSNLSLKTEAANLSKKIAAKDLELSRKQEELERLQRCLQDEQLLHAQTEATLQSLQNLHSRSQDDQKGLALELKNILRMLNDLEVRKNLLEEEIREVREENQNLSERNLSSSSSMENMQNEIVTLREVKERLEREVKYQIEQSSSLQKEILSLKEEIEGLNRSYRALIEQVEAAGLNPKCVGTSLKILKDDNLKLREINEEGSNERETLSKKLENVQELLSKKVVLESSLLDLNNELESSREKVKSLQESCQFLHGEKAMLVTEKASLLLQLKAVTDNMHSMLEKNAVLENTLTTAKVEVEGLREKSNGLEEICEFLKNEQSYILMERSNLALKLEIVEEKLEGLERRYVGLEEKYAGLEKEKEAVHSKVEELKFSLSFEKQERANSQVQSETRLSGLENQICFLKEESSWKKKELEEEVERSLKAQFEISVLQKFIKDMEEKNYSLIIECQKHVDASKLADKLISELEDESLHQQVEAELLLDEIERLRLGMHEVFKALEVDSDCSSKDKIENERTFLNCILEVIEDVKCSISKHEDDKEILLVENLVLHTLLEQLEAKGMEIELQKVNLEEELKDMAERLAVLKNEKDKLVELNGKLKSDVSESSHDAENLEAELENLCIKQNYLQKSYGAMEEAYLQVNKDNKSLLKKFTVLKEEKHEVDKVNDAAFFEYVATDNQSLILRRFTEEKVAEIKLLLTDLKRQHEINRSLENEMSVLAEKLELQKAENLVLKDAACKLEREIKGMREYNVQMKKDIISGNESLLGTEEKLLAAQMKLEAAENSNLKLCRTVDELKMDVQESKQTKEKLEHNILELSEINSIQKNEIESLYIIKRNFESEIAQTRDEIEEMWEAEAASFYFDLQITSIHDVFLKNKVHELTGVCHMLENENASKNSEIEQMKGKICSMESEIYGLKSQLYTYTPIVDALRDDLIYLEQNALLWTKLKLKPSQNQEPEFLEASAGTHVEDQSLVSLQNLQVRVKAVGKMMEEMNKPLLIRRSRSKSKQEPSTGDTKQPKSRSCLGRKKGHVNDEISETPKLQKIKTKASEARNGVLMKDIPLDRVSNSSLKKGIYKKGSGGGDDQMLELWEPVGDGRRDLTIGESLRILHRMTDKDIVYDGFENVKNTPSTDSDVERELGVDRWEVARISTEINKEVKGKRVLERLTSDAQKLEDLQVTVQNLRSKLETNDKKGKKAVKNVDFETVQEQLIEAEETVVDLVELNGRLMRSIESCPSPDEKASMQIKEAMKTRRRKVIEQARKGSERIGRLQLELQKIQYVLLKSEEEKKNKLSNRFIKNKTIVLRDFIYNGRKNSARRKKGPLCGCFQPSSSRSGRSSP